QLDGIRVHGVVEARPAAARVELGAALEQLGAARGTRVEARAVLVEQLTRPGAFRARLAQDPVPLLAELLTPLLFRLGDLVPHRVPFLVHRRSPGATPLAATSHGDTEFPRGGGMAKMTS